MTSEQLMNTFKEKGIEVIVYADKIGLVEYCSVDTTKHDKQIRAETIDDVERELLDKGFIFTQHALEVWREIAEKLKESK